VNSANIEQALGFFAPGRVMFGTDTPMDMGQRGSFCTTAITTVQGLQCLSTSAAERSQQLQALYSGNVLSMLGERAPRIVALAAAAAAPTAKL
jgi:hypothetical protein